MKFKGEKMSPEEQEEREKEAREILGEAAIAEMEKIEQEEERKEPPIQMGEIFDPVEEKEKLDKLVYSRAAVEEKEKAIKEYKEKLAYQKEGLAIMQEELIRILRGSSDTERRALLDIVDEFSAKYGFAPEQVEITEEILDKYKEKRVELRNFLEGYTDDKERFTALFGAEPKGEVEVIDGPMTIYFRCHNLEDYARIYYQNKILEKGDDYKFSDEELKNANLTGGVNIGVCRFLDLAGTIIAENAQGKGRFENDAGSQDIYIHEEQHAMKHLISEERATLNLMTIMEYLKGAPGEEIKNAIKEHLKERKAIREEDAKDEILAYMKGGHRSVEDIIEILGRRREWQGLYDYFAEDRKILNEFVRKELPAVISMPAEKLEAITEKAADEVFDRKAYDKLVKDAIDSYIKLARAYKEEFGNYSFKERMMGFFMHEPLWKWKRVAARLIEAKKMN